MLFSSFSTRSMVFAYFAKAQLPFSLFQDLFNDTAEFTLCYGLHDCSHLFQGYFIHSLSTLYYYNAPSLTTRLTGDYRDRTYTGKCSPALLDTRNKKATGFLCLRLVPCFAYVGAEDNRKGIPFVKIVSLLCKLIQFLMVALSVTVHKALILLVFLNHPYQSLAFMRVSGILKSLLITI